MPSVMIPRLVIATHNKGKLAEFRSFLAPYVNEVTSAGELDLPEPVEDGGSFIANALIKARAACKASGLPVLADDSGLCLNALGGNPGVETASWTKRGLEGLADLNRDIGTNPDRGAQSVCVLALVYPDGREQVFEGKVEGQFVWPPRGENGFGYDPTFIPLGETRTYAQMSKEEKGALSHRRRAFNLFTAYLEGQ